MNFEFKKDSSQVGLADSVGYPPPTIDPTITLFSSHRLIASQVESRLFLLNWIVQMKVPAVSNTAVPRSIRRLLGRLIAILILSFPSASHAASSTVLSNRTVVDSRDPYPITELKSPLKDSTQADGRRFVRSLSQQVSLARSKSDAKTFFFQLRVPRFSTGGWGVGQSGLGTFYGLTVSCLPLTGDALYYKFGGAPPSAQTPASQWKPLGFDSFVGSAVQEGTYYFKVVLQKGEDSVVIQESHQSLRLCKPDGGPVTGLNPDKPLWLVAHGKNDGENSFRSMNSAVRKGTGEDQVVSVDWANGAAGTGGTLDNGRFFINLGENFAAMLKSEGFITHKNIHCVGHSWGTLIGYETSRAFGGVDRFFALDPATQALGGYDDGRVNFGNISLRSTSVKGGGTAEGTFGSETKARTCDFSIRLFSEEHTGDKRLPGFFHSLPRNWFIRAMNEHGSDVYWSFFHDKLHRTAITPDMPWGDCKKLSGFDVECHGDTGYTADRAVFLWHDFLCYQTLKGKKVEARAAKKANGSLSWSYK